MAYRNVIVDDQPVRKGRAVIDIRGLNKIARRDSYPMPSIDQILELVRGKPYLSIVDMATYFYQF